VFYDYASATGSAIDRGARTELSLKRRLATEDTHDETACGGSGDKTWRFIWCYQQKRMQRA
jgi:hypothetical protein